MIFLHVHPEHPPQVWGDFLRNAPPSSIALDGYVVGEPRFEETGPYVNFNHHEGVDRLATRATCAQVLMALRMGLLQRFRGETHVFVNDCDEDVCLSWAILHRPDLCGPSQPLLNRLVMGEDLMDSTAGMYPFPQESPLLREMAWVFEPYRRFRLSGGLDRRVPSDYQGVIEDVEHRILQHLVGRGKALDLDLRYKRIGGGDGWAAVEELGAHARIGMFADGIKAFVSVRERPDGRFVYVLGRTSVYVPFDVLGLVHHLNDLEGEGSDLWGGAATIAGSPRVRGSSLTPLQLFGVIEARHGHEF